MVSTFGVTRVDPAFCDHSTTVIIDTGHVYTFAGEYDDDLRQVTQCLLCGHVLRDDGTWAATLGPDEPEIEF
jgi:hypothetical protein